MISIIVPVYKVEKYLPKCIESILSQTYKDFELILVDDGSPDECPKICDDYSRRDKRVRVIHQKNIGVSAARNAGLAAAKGEYIGFVDPDDCIENEMYKEMLFAMNRTNASMAVCGYDYYDEQGNADESRRYRIMPEELVDRKEIMKRFSDMPPTIRHGVCNKLFRKELLKKQEFLTGLHSSEDVLFLTEYVKKIDSAVIIHKPFYKNLVRSGSATHGGLSIESLSDSFIAHDRMYADSCMLYPELKNHGQGFLLDVCTLKYKEAVRKYSLLPENEKEYAKKNIKKMRSYIRAKARTALFNGEIYWKTRIRYLILK